MTLLLSNEGGLCYIAVLKKAQDKGPFGKSKPPDMEIRCLCSVASSPEKNVKDFSSWVSAMVGCKGLFGTLELRDFETLGPTLCFDTWFPGVMFSGGCSQD